MKAIEEDKQKGGTGFFVYLKMAAIPYLGTPKAGFATQLVIGKTGCIDSVNLLVHGAPEDLVMKDEETGKAGFVGFKDQLKIPGWKGKEPDAVTKLVKGVFTAKGEALAHKYVDYLERLKREGQDSSCQQLWQDWCQIVEYKIWHSGPTIGDVTPSFNADLGLGDERVDAYPGNLIKPKTKQDFGILDLKKDIADYHGISPNEKLPNLTGNRVGQQHKDWIVNASRASLRKRANVILEDPEA